MPFSAISHAILFILAGNDDMHESSEEFQNRPDPATECGVSCPLALGKIHRLIMGKTVLPRFLSCF